MVSRARRLSDAASSYKKGLSSSQPSAKLASAKTRLTRSGALKQQLPEYLLKRGEAGEPMPTVKVWSLAEEVLSHALWGLAEELFREVEGMWCACESPLCKEVH